MEFASYRMADRSGRHIATANVPKGLLFAADKDDAFQSRNRPFRLVFKCVQNKDGTGNQLLLQQRRELWGVLRHHPRPWA